MRQGEGEDTGTQGWQVRDYRMYLLVAVMAVTTERFSHQGKLFFQFHHFRCRGNRVLLLLRPLRLHRTAGDPKPG